MGQWIEILMQVVQVIAGCTTTCTGAGPFYITISSGLYGIKWASGQHPGAWWSANNMQNSGLENLTVNGTNDTGSWYSNVYMTNTFNCWVSNVRSIQGYKAGDTFSSRNHVWFYIAAHNTIQNSYFYGTNGAAQQSYGNEMYFAVDNLIQNNIYQQIVAPIINGASMGNVIFANFGIDNLDPGLGASWMQIAPAWRHDAGANYNLFEENIETGFWGDIFHGTGGANTALRNYGTGWEPGKTSDTVPFQDYSYNRFDNAIGNVWGCNNNTTTYPGNCNVVSPSVPYHTTYQTQKGTDASAAIYDLG